MKSLLGSIGIIPKEKPPINYHERAPLVLPPKMDLRPPVPGNNAEANANWPKDPDVIAARKAAADARTPWTETELYKSSQGKRLSVEEMRKYRNPNNYVRGTDAPEPTGRQADRSVMSPDELRSFAKKDEDLQLANGGLERRYLSDPPAPLLKAANGAPLKASVDPKPVVDPDSPLGFIMQQNQ
ncbi:hypothetical protein [Microvirga flavescens]|uniref:hypothetical protein n=1 Tax=Microvirga flavescens TaxID=2249811 RepID=UPI00130069AA|nr:hypothetical protein [Microvirga flavescens]